MTSMTLDPPLTNPLPPGSELVAGVDTHKNTHHVAILDLVADLSRTESSVPTVAVTRRSSRSSTRTVMSSVSGWRERGRTGLASHAR